jgi:hypothetical protein
MEIDMLTASGFGAGVGMAHLQGIIIHLGSIFFGF